MSYLKHFKNSRPSGSTFPSLPWSHEHFFFLTKGQNNGWNNVPCLAIFINSFNFFLLTFQVQNMRSDLTYRFSIVNFSKPDSLYNYGMKPVLYSQIEAERHFVGWSRVGSNIRYSCNNMTMTQIQISRQNWNGCF